MATTSNPSGLPVLPEKPQRDRLGRRYTPAIGPRLKGLLAFLFGTVSILGATGLYLLAIQILEWYRNQGYTNQFTHWMELVHILLGLVALGPFLFFGIYHWLTARSRPNKVAIRLGIILFFMGSIAFGTGFALVQLFDNLQLPTGSWSRKITYALHLITPLAAIWIYVLHRQAGPRIQWRWGQVWGASVLGFILLMTAWHSFAPHRWYAEGPREGEQYFFPSEARTSDGKFLAADTLMMDDYCMRCHPGIYNDHLHSAHKFSSFNNPPYQFSVRETRKVSLERDGNVKAARWCAGCHDPVPFFSGAFDDPDFDDVKHPTASAGITCTVCHAITNVNTTIGNGSYTIEEPPHYPFAKSSNPFLQWVNGQMIKAKPDFHKKTFLKPFHKTAEFCSTCHKVSIPSALNHYKEFLRGQNHYDSWLQSGVSGHGARSFYYPFEARTECNSCHMPLSASTDIAAKNFDGSGVRKTHNHFFPGANTGLPVLLTLDPRNENRKEGLKAALEANRNYLTGIDPAGKDRKVRIDLFGIKEGGTIDGKLTVLRPELPRLQPGQTYLVEVVVRTLGLGHHFSQGTVDSNEIWVDFQASSAGRLLAHSGGFPEGADRGPVDPWSHFINVLMLDKDGNRINRRNPQDIFTPLYDKQIPPGAGQVVHYRLDVPADITAPILLKARVRYRKFDHEYLRLIYKDQPVPTLPIVDLCNDEVTLAVQGGQQPVAEQVSPIEPAWQRWNDYGIGCYLEGGIGSKRGELLQAESAFRHLTQLESREARWNGYVNLSRVFIDRGRLDEAAQVLNKAQEVHPDGPWWSLSWFRGLVHAENASSARDLDTAIADFERIIEPAHQPRERKFDFSADYVVLNMLARTLFKRALAEGDNDPVQDQFLLASIRRYQQALALDGENLDAHFGLSQALRSLGRSVDLPDSDRSPEMSASQISTLMDRILDQKTNLDDCRTAVAMMMPGLGTLHELTSQPDKPNLPIVKRLLDRVTRAFDAESDASRKALLALVLGRLHGEIHLIFKPDDHARARATRIYRHAHPPANHAAEAIVIYPTTPDQRKALESRLAGGE